MPDARHIVTRIRRRYHDLRWRASAIVDRIILRTRLPGRVATGVVRSAQYITVRDGTRIAVDIYRPARNGIAIDARYPVVCTFDRYHRARLENGRLWTRLASEQWLRTLACYGYVIAVADVRGSGASFGSRPGFLVDQDRWDAYDVIEWLAVQPWCTGRVGMCGKSFMGITQFLAASSAPPHLVAIMPERVPFDLYQFAYPGGVFRDDYARQWGGNTDALDKLRPAAPVDEDTDRRMLTDAMAAHQANRDIHELFSGSPWRDSRDPKTGAPLYRDQSPAAYASEVAASGVAVLQLAGWSDMWPRDALLWHVNLPNPRRLIVGPWAHTHDAGWKLFPERLRWFDYWLKGIDNGVMNAGSIRYFTTGPSDKGGWRDAHTWPLPQEQQTVLYFAPPAGDRTGTLSPEPSDSPEGSDTYVVDYTTTSGDGTRWKNGYGREFEYPDMAANDARALTYTTRPLDDDVEITGHPVVRLSISATAPDIDVFVYLEEVRVDGFSEYVTEGVLRVSHRATAPPPYDNLSLPYHPGTTDLVEPLEIGAVASLTFDLHPISRIFRRGNRIRLGITGADAGNARTPVIDPPPVISVHRDRQCSSYVVLPIIDRSASAHG